MSFAASLGAQGQHQQVASGIGIQSKSGTPSKRVSAVNTPCVPKGNAIAPTPGGPCHSPTCNVPMGVAAKVTPSAPPCPLTNHIQGIPMKWNSPIGSASSCATAGQLGARSPSVRRKCAVSPRTAAWSASSPEHQGTAETRQTVSSCGSALCRAQRGTSTVQYSLNSVSSASHLLHVSSSASVVQHSACSQVSSSASLPSGAPSSPTIQRSASSSPSPSQAITSLTRFASQPLISSSPLRGQVRVRRPGINETVASASWHSPATSPLSHGGAPASMAAASLSVCNESPWALGSGARSSTPARSSASPRHPSPPPASELLSGSGDTSPHNLIMSTSTCSSTRSSTPLLHSGIGYGMRHAAPITYRPPIAVAPSAKSTTGTTRQALRLSGASTSSCSTSRDSPMRCRPSTQQPSTGMQVEPCKCTSSDNTCTQPDLAAGEALMGHERSDSQSQRRNSQPPDVGSPPADTGVHTREKVSSVEPPVLTCPQGVSVERKGKPARARRYTNRFEDKIPERRPDLTKIFNLDHGQSDCVPQPSLPRLDNHDSGPDIRIANGNDLQKGEADALHPAQATPPSNGMFTGVPRVLRPKGEDAMQRNGGAQLSPADVAAGLAAHPDVAVHPDVAYAAPVKDATRVRGARASAINGHSPDLTPPVTPPSWPTSPAPSAVLRTLSPPESPEKGDSRYTAQLGGSPSKGGASAGLACNPQLLAGLPYSPQTLVPLFATPTTMTVAWDSIGRRSLGSCRPESCKEHTPTLASVEEHEQLQSSAPSSTDGGKLALGEVDAGVHTSLESAQDNECERLVSEQNMGPMLQALQTVQKLEALISQALHRCKAEREFVDYELEVLDRWQGTLPAEDCS